MEISKISAKGQTTIPSKIRKLSGLMEGDTIIYEVRVDGLMLKKLKEPIDPYLESLTTTLGEWDSEEDNEAWNDL
jgi:antitoxin PrlF